MTIDDVHGEIGGRSLPAARKLAPLSLDPAIRNTLKLAAALFVPFMFVAMAGAWGIYHVAAQANRQVLAAQQEKIVQMGWTTATASLNALAADIAFLAQDGVLQAWLDQAGPAWRDAVSAQFLAFLQHKRQYDQVRFLDLGGMERVRADRQNGSPEIVVQSSLQDKSREADFAATRDLSRGDIYISPLGLNIEHGGVEQPIKPTLRVAAPVFDASGEKRGIVVLNYLGQRILNRLRDLDAVGQGSVFLLNAEGYWLLGPDADVEWSFAYPEAVQHTLAATDPAAWDRIHEANGFTQFLHSGAMFSVMPVSAPIVADYGAAPASTPLWYLVAHVPEANQGANSRLLKTVVLGTLAALLLGAALAVAIGHHNTRRMQAQAEIRQLNERLAADNQTLQALNEELETFSYSVSHDLRGPLRGIDGFSKALLEEYSGVLDETGRTYLSRVRNAAQRMGELIDDLLTLSKIGRSELTVAQDVDLSEIAASVIDELRRLEPSRQVDFHVRPGIVAACDARMIRIALENLLGNAWKFTGQRHPAVIEFGAREVDGRRAYYVQDNGVGFDMAHAGNLFGPFQRLHAQSEFPGTGIGLATVERIIKKHGGAVWAEAEPGRGAVIFFTL